MNNKLVVGFFCCALLCVLVFTYPLPAEAQTSNSNLIFQDDFNGSTLNLDKWSAVQNVNGGHGGNFTVADSCLCLSSNGTSYPMISTKTNPFQNTTCWTLEFNVTYSFLGVLGSGIIISAGSHLPYNGTQRAILQIWNYQTTSVDFYFLPNERVLSSDKPYVVERVPYQQTLQVKLVSDNGTYSLYVNGVFTALGQSSLQPDRIIIGHPEAAVIPFESDASWCSFKMDSISLYDNSQSPINSPSSSPSPSQEPTPNATEPTPTATDNNQTINFPISGNITSQQISNFTITSNPTNDETKIEFTVTGQNGTTGYANITIPITSIPDGLTPAIYIDGVLAENQGYTQDNQSYYVWFTTHFSTHQISIAFTKTAANPNLDTTYGIIAALGITVTVTALMLAITKSNRNKKSSV